MRESNVIGNIYFNKKNSFILVKLWMFFCYINFYRFASLKLNKIVETLKLHCSMKEKVGIIFKVIDSLKWNSFYEIFCEIFIIISKLLQKITKLQKFFKFPFSIQFSPSRAARSKTFPLNKFPRFSYLVRESLVCLHSSLGKILKRFLSPFVTYKQRQTR